MNHICGKHEGCGTWCTGKRALDADIPHNKPPMFDLTKNTDRLTFEAVRKVFYFFTTDEKLLEMLHPFTTQGNESLNMRGAELAPKYKNYCRTKSLDYRVHMVIGHHNISMYAFYSQVFKELDIPLSLNLALFLKRRHHIKLWKKGYDENPENKKCRRWKYEAKDREELLKLASQGPKAGTYKTGFTMKEKEGCKVETPRKRKKLNPCSCGGTKVHFHRNSQFCLFPNNEKADGGQSNDQESENSPKLT